MTSDKPFVNGETLLSDLSGHLIIVSEIPSTGYNNSYGAALNNMGFSEACESAPNGNQCTLVPNPGSGQLIHIRDTYIVLHPEAPDAYLQIDSKLNRVIWIDGGQGNITYQQLLTLADTMLTATLLTAQPAEIDVAPSTLVLLSIIVVSTMVLVVITIQERKERQQQNGQRSPQPTLGQ
ncbi:MAG: hypothetical protein HYY22_00215 [Thaumarchaeota archaeon]|nr:hypothetical protein [Nitrososphaerota archaeon]